MLFNIFLEVWVQPFRGLLDVSLVHGLESLINL